MRRAILYLLDYPHYTLYVACSDPKKKFGRSAIAFPIFEIVGI